MPPVTTSHCLFVSGRRGAAAATDDFIVLKSILPDLTSGLFISPMKMAEIAGKNAGLTFLIVASTSLTSRGLGISAVG